MWSTDIPPIVEPYKDALGWLLVYSRDVDEHREGEPHGDPDSPTGRYKNRAAAKRKADDINAAYRELASRAAPRRGESIKRKGRHADAADARDD